jgi:hypothetical protein
LSRADFVRVPDPDTRDRAGVTNAAAQGRSASANSEQVMVDTPWACAIDSQLKGNLISKVLVLYYSAYGHIEAMAIAVAEGARQASARVDVKHVPEFVPEEVAADVVSLTDIDRALCWGPGLRWSIMGQVLLNHLGDGQCGIEHFFQQFTVR